MQLNRLQQAWYDLIRAHTDPELTLGLLWPARVVGQDDETGELDLLIDHPKLRGSGCARIPLKSGVAGFASKVQKGDRVLVGFEEADPSKPFAMMWEPTTAVAQFNGGTKPVARVDDTVHCGYLLVQTSPSPAAQLFGPDQETEASAAQDAILLAGGVAVVLPLEGKITSGCAELTA